MKKFYLFILVLSSAIISFSSCSKTDPDCQISDSCYTERADSGDVSIRISYSQGQPGVPVVLYKGYAEDNEVIWADTLYQDEITFYLPADTRYAAEATYTTTNQTVVALDGKKLKQNKHKECGTTCYDFPSVSIDCRKL